jgi:ankyrin repeat protein
MLIVFVGIFATTHLDAMDAHSQMHKAIEKNDPNGVKIAFVQGADPKIIDILVSKGADINAIDKDGNTPLHKAAYYGKKDTAKRLIQLGADISKRNKEEKTAFDIKPDLL